MKIKGLNLFLSVILVLSLVACGTPNTNKELPSAQYSDSIISTIGSNGDQNAIVDNASTQSETEIAQTNASESDANATESNTSAQNTNAQNTSAQNTNDSQTIKEQVTQKQNDTTTLDSCTKIVANIIQDDNKVVSPPAEIIKSSYPFPINDYKLIELTNQKFYSENKFIQYLENNCAKFVSSTQEAITIINNACKSASSGLSLCFSGNVDIDALNKAFPQDLTLSRYIDINVRQVEYNCIQLVGTNSYYFGAKFTWWTTPLEEVAVDSLIAKELPSLNQGTTYDNIKKVHDYICNKANYSNATLTFQADDFSAYDALIGKLAVCQGYALAFQKFMDAMGIEGQIVKGDIKTTVASGSHAWNVVKLDGAWYSVDCTWDGQEDNTTYDYFLLGACEYPYGSITGGISLAASRYK